MEHFIKIVKSLEDSCSLIKRVAQTIINETKERRGGFLMLLGTLDASLLGNMLAVKSFIRDGDGATSPRYREQLEQAKQQQK